MELNLKEKSKQELETLLFKNKELLSKLKFKVAAGSLKNVREIRAVRKNIARILTISNAKSDPVFNAGEILK